MLVDLLFVSVKEANSCSAQSCLGWWEISSLLSWSERGFRKWTWREQVLSDLKRRGRRAKNDDDVNNFLFPTIFYLDKTCMNNTFYYQLHKAQLWYFLELWLGDRLVTMYSHQDARTKSLYFILYLYKISFFNLLPNCKH